MIDSHSLTKSTSSTLKNTALVSASTLVASLINWVVSLLLAHHLSSEQYSTFATFSAILVVAATILAAGAPALLTVHIARHGSSPDAWRAARKLHVPILLGASLICSLLALRTGGSLLALSMLLCTWCVGALALAVARLVGEGRFGLLATVRVLEMALRAVVVLAALLATHHALGLTGSIAAGTLGALVLSQAKKRSVGSSTTPAAPLTESLTYRRTGAAIGLSTLVVSIGSIDVLSAAAAGWGGHIGSYQAINMLGRLPLYVGSALALVTLNVVSRRRATPADTVRVGALVSILLSAVAFATPLPIVHFLFPRSAWSSWSGLIGPLTLGSVGGALTAVLASSVLVAGVSARVLRRLLAILVLGAVCTVTGYLWFQAPGLAWGSAVAAWLAAACLASELRVLPSLLRSVGVAALACSPLIAAGAFHVNFFVASITACLAALLVATQLRQAEIPTPAPRPQGLRILHLALEDPASPVAGGGSRRTYEINRRLAERHEVLVVTSAYPHCHPRVTDGVGYTTAGPRLPFVSARGRLSGLLYLFALPLTLRRLVRAFDPDVIIEDFAVPFSSIAIPRFTKRPVVGVVQWLFAAAKRDEYHLPFDKVERVTVRTHSTLIAVSEALANELRGRVPSAHVTSAPNALEDAGQEALRTSPSSGQNFVYLGRLERSQKGLDVLLDGYEKALAQGATGDLLVAGDGPDAKWFDAEVIARGLSSHVRRLGVVTGPSKFELLSSARVVVVPSRYETFGIVALEAMAAGSAVIVSDDGPLQEVVGSAGVVVPRGDALALATALARLDSDPNRALDLATRGQLRAATFTWDRAAEQTEEVLLGAAGRNQAIEYDPDLTWQLSPLLRPGPHLVIGNFGNGNLGDNSLGEGFLAAAKHAGVDLATLTVAGISPVEFAEPVHQVRLRSGQFLWALLRAKSVFVVAGGMLGAGMPWNVRALMTALWLKSRLGAKTALVAASISRGVDPYTRFVLRHAKHTWSFRDTGSARRGAQITSSEGILHVVDDLALQLAIAPAPSRSGVVLSMKAMADDQDTEAAIHDMIEVAKLAGRFGVPVRAICLGAAGDFGKGTGFSDAALAKRVRESVEGVEILEPRTASEALSILAGAEFVVGMRLHAAILSRVAATPVIALSAETKTAAWATEHGIVCINPGATDQLLEAVQKILSNSHPAPSTPRTPECTVLLDRNE